MSNFTSVKELDAAYPRESALGYLQDLRDLTGPILWADAKAEVLERRRACELPLHEAARLVLADYKAGAR